MNHHKNHEFTTKSPLTTIKIIKATYSCHFMSLPRPPVVVTFPLPPWQRAATPGVLHGRRLLLRRHLSLQGCHLLPRLWGFPADAWSAWSDADGDAGWWCCTASWLVDDGWCNGDLMVMIHLVDDGMMVRTDQRGIIPFLKWPNLIQIIVNDSLIFREMVMDFGWS